MMRSCIETRAGGQRLGIVRIGGKSGVERLARPVLLAQDGEANAEVGEQPRIARQAAQGMFMQGARFGGAAEVDQYAAEVGQHQRVVGRQARRSLEGTARLVEAL